MGVLAAVIVAAVAAVVVITGVVLVAFWRESGGLGHRLLGHGHRPRQTRQGRGEAVAADQQQPGAGDLGFLLGAEPKVVGIIAGLQQAAHTQLAGGQPLAEIAEHTISRHHLRRIRASAAGQQGNPQAGADQRQRRWERLPPGGRPGARAGGHGSRTAAH